MKASGPKTHPVEDATVKLYTLFGTLKTISCSAAHICLGQIRECTPGYGHVYNGQFRLSRQKAHTFSLKFTRLIRTLINADNGKALFCVPSHNYRFRQPRFTDTGYLRTVYDLNLPVKTEKVNNLECLSYAQSTWLRRKLKALVSAVKSWILLLYSKTLLEVLV